MKRILKLLTHPLFLIFLLAFFFRVYKLSDFPVGFHNDEVRVGWNAYSILKTGLDDRGNKFALYYNSFGDYRPTGIIYLTIPSIIAFGRSEFAVRFPSALLGALTVFPLYLVVSLIAKDKLKDFQKLGLLAAFVLAISPWHISISRATSEVAISMFFALGGMFHFIKGISEKKIKNFIFAAILIGTSYFFYHSIRLLAPILVGGILFYYWKEIGEKKILKFAVATLVAITLLTGLLMLNKSARGRFSQVSIFNDLDIQYELSRMPFEEGPNKVFIARFFHNKPLVYARRFSNEYLRYFSGDFFLNSVIAKPARYQTIGIGLLTYVEVLLLVFGLIGIAQKKFSVLPLILLLLAPIPAALTTEDAPNLHRAFYMLPFLAVIEAYGLYQLMQLSYSFKFKSNKFILNLKNLVFLGLVLNFGFYLHMYYVHNRVHLPLYRNVGAKELAIRLNEIQKNYDSIILTNYPDELYTWIAFFTNQDPKSFNQDAAKREKGVWGTQNYTFSGQRCPSRDAFNDPDVKKLLVVDGEGCASESNLLKRTDINLEKILRPDESEVYNLFSSKEK